jgi:hypothetical protein
MRDKDFFFFDGKNIINKKDCLPQGRKGRHTAFLSPIINSVTGYFPHDLI